MLATHLKSFRRAKVRITRDALFDQSWICKTGLWPDPQTAKALVLKLLKRHWSQDSNDCIVSTSGIFFSVWINSPDAAKGGLHYNLHALKLRQLAGYSLQSRKFASAFRTRFLSEHSNWPDVKTAFGPQTLFQGFIECRPDRFDMAASRLAIKFLPLGVLIDELLSESTTRPRRSLGK